MAWHKYELSASLNVELHKYSRSSLSLLIKPNTFIELLSGLRYERMSIDCTFGESLHSLNKRKSKQINMVMTNKSLKK